MHAQARNLPNLNLFKMSSINLGNPEVGNLKTAKTNVKKP